MLAPLELDVAEVLMVIAVGAVALWFGFKNLWATVRDIYNGLMEIPREIVRIVKEALRHRK